MRNRQESEGPTPSSKAVSRLVDHFLNVRSQSEALAAPLNPEDMAIQSMPDVSPTKWHLAHTTWFFEAFILQEFDPDYRVFDPKFNYLFNSYYEAIGDRHPRARRGMITRPGVQRVLEYRAYVTEAMAGLAEKTGNQRVLEILELGCHHEEQHQELLLTDIKHVLYQNPTRPAYFKEPSKPEAAKTLLDWKTHPEGLYEIGFQGKTFHFDCEAPCHKIWLRSFQMADRPVTNGEFLEFIEAGGYQTPSLWLSDGWAFIQETRASCPLYWRNDGESWLTYTLYGEHPLDPNQPATHLTYYEAEAFARWAGARLPLEAEHEVFAVMTGVSHPGKVWEWTGSAYLPYPGFQPRPGAVGEYNGKFMVNQMVLRGGSFATPRGHWRPTYRNFFYPPSQWQFTGVRLAKDA